MKKHKKNELRLVEEEVHLFEVSLLAVVARYDNP